MILNCLAVKVLWYSTPSKYDRVALLKQAPVWAGAACLVSQVASDSRHSLPARWDLSFLFLASQDAIEVMFVTEWVTYWVSVSIDFTDVTLVSDDTYRRLYWCDPDDPDEPDES